MPWNLTTDKDEDDDLGQQRFANFARVVRTPELGRVVDPVVLLRPARPDAPDLCLESVRVMQQLSPGEPDDVEARPHLQVGRQGQEAEGRGKGEEHGRGGHGERLVLAFVVEDTDSVLVCGR